MQRLGLPLMVKVPDGAQGRDLAMASDELQLARLLDEGLARSALLLVQSRIPAEFDWRIGFSTARRCLPAAVSAPSPATAFAAASTPST